MLDKIPPTGFIEDKSSEKSLDFIINEIEYTARNQLMYESYIIVHNDLRRIQQLFEEKYEKIENTFSIRTEE